MTIYVKSFRYHQQTPLDILRDMIKEDELHMIRYLLSSTNLLMEVKNGPDAKAFT